MSVFVLLLLFPAYGDAQSVPLSGQSIDKSVEDPKAFAAIQQVLNQQGEQLKETQPVLYQYLFGVDATLRGDLEQGQKAFEKALELVGSSGDEDMQMRILRRLLEYDEYYDSTRGLMEHGERLELLGSAQQSEFYLSLAYIKMAKAYFIMTEDHKVSVMLDKAMEAAISPDTRWIHGAANALLGDIQEDYGNRDQAVSLYTKALTDLAYEPQDTLIFQDRYLVEGILVLDLIKTGTSSFSEGLKRIEGVTGMIEREIPRIPTLLMHEGRMGEIHAEGKDYINALAHFGTSEELATRVIRGLESPPDYILQSIRMKHAKAAFESKDYRTAAELYAALTDQETFSNSEQYSDDMQVVRSIEEKQQLDQIDLLSKLNATREEKLQQQSLFLKVTGVLLVLITGIVVALVMDYRRINDLRHKLYLESVTDHLTQIYNRGKILNILEEHRAQLGVVAMLDIDHFKQINDTYGHIVGDQVLQEISEAVSRVLRSGDEIGRYGGEEFLIVLKDSTLEQGAAVCERIRQAVADGVWTQEGLRSSVSIGLTSINGDSVDDLVQAADIRLYEAKRSGRNRLAY